MYPLLLSTLLTTISVVRTKLPEPKNLHPDVGLNVIDLVTKYKYPIESHEIETEDGYILTLHRIPRNSTGTENSKKPVLLMHGFWCSSVDWVNMGPGTALAFLLADEGYDVWLGNQRGNTWSRKHANLDPVLDASKFFDFSFNEIGLYDLPAKIDYILNKTAQSQLFYVGHSQGTTSFFVMCSERPEYNSKIKLMTALSPVAYMNNMPHPVLKEVAENYYDLVETLTDIFSLHELMPHYDYFTELGSILCNENSPYQKYCSLLLNFIGGFDTEIDPNFIPVITSNNPAGASFKQILHYFQAIRYERFAHYDYGTTKNIDRYGQKTPPLYNISKIIAPVSLYYANNDWLTAVEDVLKLSDDLPNLKNSKEVPLNKFNHLDFLWAKNVVNLLYKDVIDEIKSVN